MKSVLLALAVSLCFLALPRSASALGSASAIVLGSVQALDFVPALSLNKSFFDQEFDPIIAAKRGSVEGTLAESGQSLFDFGSASASAVATTGIVGVQANASGDIGSNIHSHAEATARYFDIFQLTIPFNPNHVDAVTVTVPITLDGTLDVVGTDSVLYNNKASVAAEVRVEQLGPTIGLAATAGVLLWHNDQGPASILDLPPRHALQLVVSNLRVNQNANLTIQLQAAADVSMGLGQGRQGPGTGNASASFGDTLAWGGITSVVDSATGLPVDGWVVTSDSGFDYAHAAVPEPATWTLLLIGLLSMSGRRALRRLTTDRRLPALRSASCSCSSNFPFHSPIRSTSGSSCGINSRFKRPSIAA